MLAYLVLRVQREARAKRIGKKPDDNKTLAYLSSHTLEEWPEADGIDTDVKVGVSTVDLVPLRGHACRALLVRTDEYTTNTQAPEYKGRYHPDTLAPKSPRAPGTPRAARSDVPVDQAQPGLDLAPSSPRGYR